MCKIDAGQLPVFNAILMTLTLGVTYVVSVARSDVDPLFPYISAAGNTRPESCIFSLLLNLTSMLSLVIVYLRYRLVHELNRDADTVLNSVNLLSFLVGLLAFVGLLGVANFQETALLIVHMTSAFICFGCGCIYFLMQSFVTWRMHPLYTGRRICWIRSVITSVAILSFITSVLFGTMASIEFHKRYPDRETPRPWSRKVIEPGYNLHVVSAVAEWVLAACNAIYLLSFSRDFEKIRVQIHVMPLVSHLDESPIWQSPDTSISAEPLL